MGILIVKTQAEADSTYLLNSINYVTHRHTESDLCYGVNIAPDKAYRQMTAVKEYYNKTSGNQLVHFIVSFDCSITDSREAFSLAQKISQYYSDRYQIIFAIHEKINFNNRNKAVSFVHAHIILNSVSFTDGKMFSCSTTEVYGFLNHIRNVTKDHNWRISVKNSHKTIISD